MSTVPPRSAPTGSRLTERGLRKTGEGLGCLDKFTEFKKGPQGDGLTKTTKPWFYKEAHRDTQETAS